MKRKKTILLGVSGSIAAYKAAYLTSSLIKQDFNVHVIMTKNATQFITPVTFETITGNKTPVDTFDRNFQFDVEHISLARSADLVIIAPATANVISKLAHGIADDMLTTTVLACDCHKLIAPAMNTNMYVNPVTGDNLNKLRSYGWQIIEPVSGRLACGDAGVGKMVEPEQIVEAIKYYLAYDKDMKGLKVLVTAGPTQEAIDPVRYITNHSSGKMGYAIAQAASQRGAEVTLVSGKTNLMPPSFMDIKHVVSAQDMFEAVTSVYEHQDIIIKAAAVADYCPVEAASNKVKKSDDDLSIAMKRTPDILQYLGDHRKKRQFLCGFSMETQDLIENSKKKLKKKHLDMIAANSLTDEGSGFAGDTNLLMLITQDEEIRLPLLSKEEAAHRLLDAILKKRKKDSIF